MGSGVGREAVEWSCGVWCRVYCLGVSWCGEGGEGATVTVRECLWKAVPSAQALTTSTICKSRSDGISPAVAREFQRGTARLV